MCAITERGRFGMLAAAKPHFFRLVEQHFNASVRRAVNISVGIITERLFFAESAGTPGIYFPGLRIYHFGAAFGYAGKIFIGDRFHFIQIV
jgi:hypothetical protein